MNADFQQEFLNSVKIYNFLEVKAPDRVIKHNSVRDINNEIIDCNIYHPKYGSIKVTNKYGEFDVRLGFITTEKDNIITSCIGSYYSKTNERVYYQFNPLITLCVQKDGSLTNKDGIKVIDLEVERVFEYQTRTALDVNDFAEIYEREFLVNKLTDTASNHMTLKAQLTKEVNKLIAYHEDNREYNRTLDLLIIAKANEFLNWLPTYAMPPIIIDGILFNAEFVAKIHKKYNNIIFFSISEKQLFDALNNPKEFGNSLKVMQGNEGKCMGLIRLLFNKTHKNKDWEETILKAVNLSKETYSRKSKKLSLEVNID